MGAWGRIFFVTLIFAAVALVAAAWLSGPAAAGAPVLAAVVMGTLGVAFVALVGVGLWSLHAEDLALDEATAEKLADRRLASALRAEIDLAIRELSREFDPATADSARRTAHHEIDRAEGPQPTLPAAASPPDFVVFDRSEDPLSGLPEFAIRRVVQFHQTVSGLRGLVDDIRAKRFDGLSRNERASVVDRFYDTGAAALFRALKAKAALTATLRDVDAWPEGRWRSAYLTTMERALAERILDRAPGVSTDTPTIGGLIERSEPS